MLESLSNNVAGSHDCYKTYLLHALLQFYFSLGKTLQSYVRRGIFRTKSKIYERAFFTSVKPYFKNVLNSIELPLGSMVYTTHTFVKKLTAENFGRKILLLTMEQFFSKLCNGMAPSQENEKRFLKLASI